MVRSLFQKARKAIYNPIIAKRVAKQKAVNFSYIPRNKKKAFEQRNKQSRVGLVLNWALHVRGDWTVAEYPFFIEKFIERFDPLIITSQKMYDKHKGHLDNIFAFGARNNKGHTLEYHSEQTILLFASDPNNKPEWLHSYIEKNNIDYTLTPYYQPFLHYLPNFDESKLVHFPWAIPSEFIIEPDSINYHGDSYLAITGARGSEIYEIRDWCRSQSDVKSFQTSGHQNRRFSHAEYYKWLRQFDAMIAAGSFKKQWQYLFAKYYEIPAAGSLLFAQSANDLDRAGFSKRNCAIFDSKKEFIAMKEAYLDSPEDHCETRRRGAKLISNQHTISDRLELIDGLFE